MNEEFIRRSRKTEYFSVGRTPRLIAYPIRLQVRCISSAAFFFPESTSRRWVLQLTTNTHAGVSWEVNSVHILWRKNYKDTQSTFRVSN